MTVDLEAGATRASAPSMDAEVTQESDVPPPDRGLGVVRDAAGTPADARGNGMSGRPEKDARVRPDR